MTDCRVSGDNGQGTVSNPSPAVAQAPKTANLTAGNAKEPLHRGPIRAVLPKPDSRESRNLSPPLRRAEQRQCSVRDRGTVCSND